MTSTPLPDAMPRPVTLGALLRWQAQTRPQSCALRFESHSICYADLLARTQRAAATLWHTWGVRSGDRVAYLGLNHPDQIVLLWACAQIGAICVPMNYRLAPLEWAALLADCTPRCWVCDAHYVDAARALLHDGGLHADLHSAAQRTQPLALQGIAVHLLDDLLHTPAAHEAPDLATPDAPALLVYTSGTTGRPKGALHTQHNLLANMDFAQEIQAQTATDLIATVLPLFHLGGLCIQTLPALLAGACVIVHARFDAGATLRCIAQERPTLTLQVPATMKALIEHPDWPRTDLRSLRAVWAGSSVLPAFLVQAFHARGVPVCNVYGSTETGPFSIALPAAHARTHVGSCGWPAVSGAQRVEVTLHPTHPRSDGASADDVGELCIRAPNVAQRYWPDVAALDADGFFHTGDLARCAPDGSFTVVGRVKDMLISGGENIYPAEIENLLTAQPGVAECAVIGMPDAHWGEVVVACVIARDDADTVALQQTLAAFLMEHIARYKLPRRWVWLSSLPKTALGKVQKERLREMLGGDSTL